MSNRSLLRNFTLRHLPSIVFAVTFAFAIAPSGAPAYTLKTLHSFCVNAGCPGGDEPFAGLLMGQSGDLYGTTPVGGKYDSGVVFELTPNGNTYKEHILKNFCKQANCADGDYPLADLIMDGDGNLYGTTFVGGKHELGSVFKLTHLGGQVTFAIVYSFCSKAACADGARPMARLAYAGQASGAPWDGSSPLFGTTVDGGADNKGTAYKLAPNGSSWTYQVLHSFNPATNGSALPGPLLVDSFGNLFGVTGAGAKYGAGALYRLAAGTWKETTLHNFCAEANCTDGNSGVGRLAIDAAGDLFGTTAGGGSGSSGCDSDCGVVFERATAGGYSVIYNFGSQSGDGIYPQAGPIIDGSGNLYGTTYFGGTDGLGTVFKLSPGTPWTETVLYNFCSENACTDGANPNAPVIMDAGGNLYGTTYNGGANSAGTVFELTP
ncbi:MAG TPA: choice-of-anchor tandem repeat GloVer-containing protein [Rhizomicrobium sp.]|nr:choice-of-anchor tandem repeat GloVer-containing protein [Rhizomicrobium sp.]